MTLPAWFKLDSAQQCCKQVLMQGLQRNSHLLSSNQCQTQDMLERQHSPVSSAFTLGVAIQMTLPAWFKLNSVQQCCKQVLMQRLQRNSHLHVY